jgi:hypothetical protein
MPKVARLLLPVERWPEADRIAWLQALSDEFVPAMEDDIDDGLGSGPLASRRYAGTLRPASLRNARKGYGRFLSFLFNGGLLVPNVPAGERLTRPIAALYLDALKQAGNSDQTCAARFFELRAAMKILAPDIDFAWLVTPGGKSIWSLAKPAEPKELAVDHETLLRWSKEMFGRAMSLPPGLQRAHQYRDALVIGVLTTRAPRLRSISLIQIGVNLLRDDEHFRFIFRPRDTKTERRLEYALPDWLCPHMVHYIDVERDYLLARGNGTGRLTDSLWVGDAGEPLTEYGVASLVFRLSERWLDNRFGAHAFRAALTTAMAEADPANPGAAAALLGHSPEVSEAYYNKARADQAAEAFLAATAAERESTRSLAMQEFRDKLLE